MENQIRIRPVAIELYLANMKSLPKCSKCGKVLTPIYENNGFIMPEGQEYPELTGYKCLACGEIVDIIKN